MGAWWSNHHKAKKQWLRQSFRWHRKEEPLSACDVVIMFFLVGNSKKVVSGNNKKSRP